MFICGICFIYTQPREKATRVVVETREVDYPFRKDANSFLKCERIPGTNKFYPGKPEKSDDPGGRGVEIVKEVLACEVCAEARNKGTVENLHSALLVTPAPHVATIRSRML